MRDLRYATTHLLLFDAEVLQAERELVPYGIAHDLGFGALHDEPDGSGRFPGRKAARIFRRNHFAVFDDFLSRNGDRPRARAFGRQLRLERAQKGGLAGSG